MIFHSLCFSLGDPQKNEYVYMLLLLIQSLLKTGNFKPDDDIYYVMADAATIAVVREIPQLARLVKFVEIPKPIDCYEGMTYKYRLFEFVEASEDTVMYIDVDMLALKCCRLAIPPDKVYICAEGSKWDTNYRGSDEYILDLPVGVTAGFFIYKWGERVADTFREVLRRMAGDEPRYYTLDQPYFNRALTYRAGSATLLPETFISFNGNNNLERAYFMNLAGCPGEGPFHFRKALSMYLMLF